MNMGSPAPLNNTTVQWETTTVEPENVTKGSAFVDEADDAIWILTSTFIIFTMQSGKCLEKVISW